MLLNFLLSFFFCLTHAKLESMNPHAYRSGVWHTMPPTSLVVGFAQEEKSAVGYANVLMEYNEKKLTVTSKDHNGVSFDWLDGQDGFKGSFFKHDGLCSFVAAETLEELYTSYKITLASFSIRYYQVAVAVYNKKLNQEEQELCKNFISDQNLPKDLQAEVMTGFAVSLKESNDNKNVAKARTILKMVLADDSGADDSIKTVARFHLAVILKESNEPENVAKARGFLEMVVANNSGAGDFIKNRAITKSCVWEKSGVPY